MAGKNRTYHEKKETGYVLQLRGLLARYEDECAIVQPDKSRVFPPGVIPQEISPKKEFNIKFLYNLLRWARKLL